MTSPTIENIEYIENIENIENTTLPIPEDVLSLVAKKINSVQITANLARVNRTCYSAVSDEVYRRDALNPGIPSLYRAIQFGDCDIIRNSILAYRRVGAPGMLDGSSVQWSTFSRAVGPAWKLSLQTNPAILAVESQQIPVLRNVVKYLTREELDALCLVENDCNFGYVDKYKTGDILSMFPFPPRVIEKIQEGPGRYSALDKCCCFNHDINGWWLDLESPLFSMGCGETALCLAVRTLNLEMAEILLKAGASPTPPPVSSSNVTPEVSILACLLGSNNPWSMVEYSDMTGEIAASRLGFAKCEGSMELAVNTYPYRRKMIKLLVKHGMDLGEEEARLRDLFEKHTLLGWQPRLDFDSDDASCVRHCIRPIDNDDVDV